MKKLLFTLNVTILAAVVIATPIDFDNMHLASSGYGIVGDEGRTRLMTAYNNKIYFFIREDGTTTPSKFYCYDPSSGWANFTNHSMVAETTGMFTTLRQINNSLYFADSLGNVYSFDGRTLATLPVTPFSENNYVTSIVEFNGLTYFGTSTASVYRYNGSAYELVYEVSNRSPILDMATWQKDGYLYVSVGPQGVCCPPTGYTIRSLTGDIDSWETVFGSVWHMPILMPTPEYLYTGVLDSAYGFSSSIRKSSDGTDFPVIQQSSGEYKFTFGSLYHDNIAYFFTNGWYNYGFRIIDENGTISIIPNQNGIITQAVALNGQIYALLANSIDVYQPSEVHLLTTAMLTVVSLDGGEEYVSGNSVVIHWKALDSISNISIEYSCDNGLNWTMIAANTPNDGEYEWTLPVITSDTCLIKISDVDNPSIYDVSDNTFKIYVCRAGYHFLDSIGKEGTADGEFISPRSIAFDKDGNYFVSDNDNNRVQKFTKDGQFVTKWNCNDPMGIAVDQDGHVYVADASGNSIKKYIDNNGTYDAVAGWQINANHPLGVALDMSKNLYICEEGDSSVKKYSPDGIYVATLSGNFNTPTYLQVDSGGNVYVADHYSHCIKKLSSDDGINYTFQILCNASYPGAVAVDKFGYVYVTEYNDNHVKKFSPEGNPVSSWGQKGGDSGNFTNPIGIQLDSFGHVFVVDHGASRIQIFGQDGPLMGDLNSDCYVNLADFEVFASQWLECGNPFDSNCR